MNNHEQHEAGVVATTGSVIASGSRNAYRDVPLRAGKRDIRFLRLQPGSCRSAIQGTLEVVSLDSRPRYEALSYTWGIRSENRSIQLNGGHQLPITDNLFRALRRLRRRFTVRIVWIHAICINQADVFERGHQVSMMGDIYESTQYVEIWLGEPGRVSPFNLKPLLALRELVSLFQIKSFRGFIRRKRDSLQMLFHLLQTMHTQSTRQYAIPCPVGMNDFGWFRNVY